MQSNKLKQINKEKVIYLLISLVYFAAVIIVLIYATKFLNKEFGRVFELDEETVKANMTTLNLAGLGPVSEKLGLTSTQNLPEIQPIVIPVDTDTSTPAVNLE